MGVGYAVVCRTCKKWIDCHKCYSLCNLCHRETPFTPKEWDQSLISGYWGSRAFWFIWKHRKHEVEWLSDECDEYYDTIKPFYEEVFPHKDEPK